MTRASIRARAIAYEYATDPIDAQRHYQDLPQADLEVFWADVRQARIARKRDRDYTRFWRDQGTRP